LAYLRRLAGVILAQNQSSGMTQSTAKQHKVEKNGEHTTPRLFTNTESAIQLSTRYSADFA
jgi:hypothetical protein